jgi:predicted ATP-binding protein involved in virulence
MRNTLPGIKDIAVKQYDGGRGQPSMTLMCTTSYGEIPFSGLSLGYQTMSAWLIDFVKRMHEAFPDLDEPDDGPAVVLIDEFDLHMHPRWQREAMAALSKEFPNTQFIVTAHSPIVVQATEGHAKLIVLRRKQREDGTEEVIAGDDPKFAAGWRVDQILESLYDMSPRMDDYDKLIKRRVELRQKEKLGKIEQSELLQIEARLETEAPPATSEATEQLLKDLKKALQGA